MTGIGQVVVDGFWAVDRALGGDQPPACSQRFAAAHPLGLALFTGISWAVFFLLLPNTQPLDVVIGLAGGVFLGGLFGLTGLYERCRQRRLVRLGLWEGSKGR
ncbi:hypothetical protein [Streptomyces sp. RKAG337]|uniref:hypothetical protein n=1 Tax=Streptomyces sp. RKAG337 TaxID=2893404 RepID=UPI0020338289|nr:hypothetical protein [Streptomyces sp. RKAG337]MCM2425031.1 hypothetical protein [Streptomyces sp. RKAG337]